MPKVFLELVRSPYHLLLALLAAVFYRFPSRYITVIGITGTKGKTTVTELLAKILETAGSKVAVANGIHFKIGNKEETNYLKMTMPGRGKLQKFLREAVSADCKYAIIEVTSEGIKQHRHRFIKFDVAAITNLQKEHIEVHGSFEAYRAAKGELFKAAKNIHVLNADDPSYEYYNSFHAKKKIRYSLNNQGPELLRPQHYELGENDITILINDEELKVPLLGVFNVYNTLCAVSIARALNIDFFAIKRGLAEFRGVAGRMEFIQKEPFAAIVDYAHTPDSLKAVYQTTRKLITDNCKLICVLGAAGGGRDRWKRPIMGSIAAEYCDRIILTDEDPYDEDPNQILAELESGITNYQLPITKILNRKEAIGKAISLAERGDAVIITGKGSERWIAVAGGKKIPWSDAEIAKEAITQL